jgi:stage V sporulation protein G
MEVTEIRIKLAGNLDDKLQAFCTITFDNCFVVRDLKIIRGARGAFVAMPSRKLTDLCPRCGGKNHLRAHFCNECGHRLPADRAEHDEKGRAKLHADIAHPIHSEYREGLQNLILDAYEKELERAEQPGYRPPADEFLEAAEDDRPHAPPDGPPPPPPGTRDSHPHRFGEGILP